MQRLQLLTKGCSDFNQAWQNLDFFQKIAKKKALN